MVASSSHVLLIDAWEREQRRQIFSVFNVGMNSVTLVEMTACTLASFSARTGEVQSPDNMR